MTGDRALGAGLVLLLGVVVAALAGLQSTKSTPGEDAAAPLVWPAESALERGSKPTLVLFAHPRCPCTRASLAELELLMGKVGGKVSATVALALPENVGPEWEKSELVEIAAAIPGVRVVFDRQRRESRRFGARTSGQVVYYDREGRLLFAGGITASRGHEGDNAGLNRLISIIEGGRAAGAPVFGCPLENPQT